MASLAARQSGKLFGWVDHFMDHPSPLFLHKHGLKQGIVLPSYLVVISQVIRLWASVNSGWFDVTV